VLSQPCRLIGRLPCSLRACVPPSGYGSARLWPDACDATRPCSAARRIRSGDASALQVRQFTCARPRRVPYPRHRCGSCNGRSGSGVSPPCPCRRWRCVNGVVGPDVRGAHQSRFARRSAIGATARAHVSPVSPNLSKLLGVCRCFNLALQTRKNSIGVLCASHGVAYLRVTIRKCSTPCQKVCWQRATCRCVVCTEHLARKVRLPQANEH